MVLDKEKYQAGKCIDKGNKNTEIEKSTMVEDPARQKSSLENAEQPGIKPAAAEQPSSEALADLDPGYLTGVRLHIITIGICLALLFSMMETTITSTSILAITNQLSGFDKSSWVFTAYLLSYSGLLIVWAKISDVFGRKPVLIVATVLFAIFSGACGASQTLVQLIMFRWLQGAAGCGVYSIGTMMFFELVPPHKWPNYTALTALVIAVSMATGPLIGGAIVDKTTWRWIFLINCPAGALSSILLSFSLPRKLHNEPFAQTSDPLSTGGYLKLIQKVDIVGALLLLGASLFLCTALQLAAAGDPFDTAPVLPLLIIAPFLWIGFVFWEWHVTTKCSQLEPIFPWRFFKIRLMMAITLNTFLTGALFTGLIVQLPQRFISVSGLSAIDAGVRLLPFSVAVPGMSTLIGLLLKTGIAPFHVQLIGSILQLVGAILLAIDTPSSVSIPARQYGYQILAGAGIGSSNIALLILVPYICEKRDLAGGTASVAQFRLLGGLTALSIVNGVFVRWVRQPLLGVLSSSQVSTVLERTEAIVILPERTRAAVRAIFAEGYNLQLKILIGFAAAQVLVTAAMWQKEHVKVIRKKE